MYVRVSLCGLCLVLTVLSWVTGGSKQLSWAQFCTMTVSPGQSIQKAIDTIPYGRLGDVICLEAGTWEENLVIDEKNLTLRGAGKGKTIVKGNILIMSYTKIEVTIEELIVADIRVGGRAQMTLINSQVSAGISLRDLSRATISNSHFSSIYIEGSAQATIISSQILGNEGHGIVIGGSAQATITNSQVWGHRWIGLYPTGAGIVIKDSAQAAITNSKILKNGYSGIVIEGSAQATITNSQVSENGTDGISIGDSAQAVIKDSTIEGNGANSNCSMGLQWVCNGIQVSGKSQARIIDSIIRNNTDWGVAATLEKCGYLFDNFTGKVIFEGNNRIYGNPRGEVCLP